MSVFDSKILEATERLDTITNDIIDNLSSENVKLEEVDRLYSSRKAFFKEIDNYIVDSKDIILENKSEWKSIMDPLKQKDEKAMQLLKRKVKSMEEELKQKQKQKNVLRYKENKQ